MNLPASDDLLSALYEGPFEQPLWSGFLDRLRAQLRANYVSLIFRPPDRNAGDPVELFSGNRSPPALRQLYRHEIYSDPLPYFRMQEGHVYALAELLDMQDPQHRTFFEGLLVPSGMRRGRIVRITEPQGVSAWLCANRDEPEFCAADNALLNGLVPHIRGALRTYVALEKERFRANVTTSAVQRLNYGWISLDRQGRIMEASAHADHVLRHCADLCRDRQGRLTARSTALNKELEAVIEACAKNARARPRALHVSRDPWVDMLVVPAQRNVAPTGPAPVAIAYIHGDSESVADRHEQIAELFGLLPSEARLAFALSRGMTITEAAAHLGLSEQTARSYSKAIYAKMGARGQSDLIRFVLASALALA